MLQNSFYITLGEIELEWYGLGDSRRVISQQGADNTFYEYDLDQN